MNFVAKKDGQSVIFITREDAAHEPDAFRSSLRDLTQELPAGVVTADVTDLPQIPLHVAAVLMELARDFDRTGGRLNLRTAEDMGAALKSIGLAGYFAWIEEKQS